MKKILITGGAGFLGTSIIERLLRRNDIEKIVVLDNLLFKDQAILPLLRDPRLEIVVGDVRDKELLGKLASEADVIYPLAALVGAPICAKYAKEAVQVNTEQLVIITRNMAKGTKIIYPNTNSIYGKSDGKVTEASDIRCLSVYAQTKYNAEQMCLKEGGTSLRLATLAGVSYRQRKDLLVNTMCLKALTDSYVILYEPNFMRCYISVADAARAFEYALDHYEVFSGNAYNCGNTSLNCSKLQLAKRVQFYEPKFLIETKDYLKDPDQRDYWVSNDKLEATGFTCIEGFDTIIPQVLKAYRVLLDIENYMLT